MTNYLAILPLIIRRDDIAFADALCDALCDDIIADRIPRPIASMILAIARIFDRTESYHAAHLRDAIRDS